MNTNLSAEALAYFVALAEDACNWSGHPLVGGNVSQGVKENGYLTACKKEEVLTTSFDGRDSFVNFTEKGVELAASMGVKVRA